MVQPTLPSESDVHQVVEPMQYLVNPTLPLESELNQVVESIPSSINPTLPSESEVSVSHILFTASSEISEQGGTKLVSNEPPPRSWIASFD